MTNLHCIPWTAYGESQPQRLPMSARANALCKMNFGHESRGSLREPTLLGQTSEGGWVAGAAQREGPETEGTLKLSGPSASLLTLPPRRINSQPILEPTLRV